MIFSRFERHIKAMALPQKIRDHFDASATGALLAPRRGQSIAALAQPQNKIGATLYNLPRGVYNNPVLPPPETAEVIFSLGRPRMRRRQTDEHTIRI
jgi:hypothetical protein